jgi:hypothetical protein
MEMKREESENRKEVTIRYLQHVVSEIATKDERAVLWFGQRAVRPPNLHLVRL